MAYAKTRSVNRELEAGATDGKYRKVIADRGGEVEHTFVENRMDLTSAFYGIHESPVFQVPGRPGQPCTNPYAVATPAPDPGYF
jgi:hypothetical protein